MKIHIKRVYESASKDDGVRILVDRLWPRGFSKERAGVDHWFRDLAPSTDLRRRFKHDPERWDEFRRCYFSELAENADAIQLILDEAARSPITLIFAAKDMVRNNAVALREYLLQSTAS